MKNEKQKKKNQSNSQSSPIEITAQDINLIRARETSRTRRNNIDWLS